MQRKQNLKLFNQILAFALCLGLIFYLKLVTIIVRSTSWIFWKLKVSNDLLFLDISYGEEIEPVSV
jgi:hypothetical protein